MRLAFFLSVLSALAMSSLAAPIAAASSPTAASPIFVSRETNAPLEVRDAQMGVNQSGQRGKRDAQMGVTQGGQRG